jgi:hypothetical protein
VDAILTLLHPLKRGGLFGRGDPGQLGEEQVADRGRRRAGDVAGPGGAGIAGVQVDERPDTSEDEVAGDVAQLTLERGGEETVVAQQVGDGHASGEGTRDRAFHLAEIVGTAHLLPPLASRGRFVAREWYPRPSPVARSSFLR